MSALESVISLSSSDWLYKLRQSDLFFLVSNTLAAVLVLAASIILVVFTAKAKKHGMRIRLSVVACILMVATVPLCISYAVRRWSDCAYFMILPDDFIKTDAVVEDYSYNSFTLNGVRYVSCTDTYFNRSATELLSEPVACYMPEGLFERHMYTSFYRVENGNGFDVLYNGTSLYINKADHDAFVEYYSNPDNLYWKMNDPDEAWIRLPETVEVQFREYWKNQKADLADAVLAEGDVDILYIESYSTDGLFWFNKNREFDKLALYDGQVYNVYADTMNQLRGRYVFVLMPIPDVYADAFIELFDAE